MSRLTDKLNETLEGMAMTQAELARRLDVHQQTINGLFTGKVSKSHIWREVARELNIPEEEMRELMVEAGRESGKNTKLPKTYKTADVFPEIDLRNGMIDAESQRNMPVTKLIRMIPVLGAVVGGADGEYVFNGNRLDSVECPLPLENVPGAYAVWTYGESMKPRYNPGDLLFVHPNRPAQKEEGVVVQILAPEEGVAPHGFVKEFVGWTANKLVLRQYNPESKIEFDRKKVVSVHPIVLSGKY